MSDLVERLRAKGRYGHTFNPDGEEAADRIATLEAQLAAVTEERDLWKQSEATCDALYTKLAGELAARDAEIAAWLRGEVAYELAANSEHDDLLKLADAIASGDYAKGQTDAQQGD